MKKYLSQFVVAVCVALVVMKGEAQAASSHVYHSAGKVSSCCHENKKNNKAFKMNRHSRHHHCCCKHERKKHARHHRVVFNRKACRFHGR